MYKILYVEDEKILGQLVADTLAAKGYDVKRVSNGTDAVAAFHQYRPHLCLLDVMLPGMDGFELATKIRAADAKLPIIFLTAKVQTADVVAGFHAGCNDYIRKPFGIDELLLRVQNWLSEKYGAETDNGEYRIGDILYKPDKQNLQTADGTVITLTFKENTLLHLLYKHRNTVVERNYLLQQVWGNDSQYNSRTLDVYINRLRKLFAGTANQVITLKGIGYRFICE